MTGDVQAIFEQVFGLPVEERNRQLDRACGDDAELRREVEALIEAHAASSAFLANPTTLMTESAYPSGPVSEGPGQTIGRYKLLQTIGEGGFGKVFMAEQREPVVRKVALKIIKPGMDTKQVIARFEAERQALAMMDHANIAKVFDAGETDSGRPYFVMELVKGDPVTVYCDRENLNVRQRLELFTQICSAVQHAHTKGVIHRDIKPSNVLVTLHDGKPTPKVIDFGIAKAVSARLTEKTLFTEFRQLIGTPEYMSPEQAEAAASDIDTRSDVYSLGVLAYQLLTGTTPFDARRLRSAAFGEMQRIIREEEPPRPSTRLSSLQSTPRLSEPRPSGSGPDSESTAPAQPLPHGRGSDQDSAAAIARHRCTDSATLVRTLRGDLDWIVMKCLEKDRTRRYETAVAVADDVRRHLTGEPVIAAPPSIGYRVQKLVRRNRGAVTAGATIALVLMLGIVGTSIGMLQARRGWRQAAYSEMKAIESERKTDAALRVSKEYAERLRRIAYATNIALANSLYQNNDTAKAGEVLNACPEDLRGYEWNYLNNLTDNSVLTIPAHKDAVNAVAITPDGRWMVSGGNDGVVGVWDRESGRLIHNLTGHSKTVLALGISPDGKRIVSGSEDHTLRIWSLEDGSLLSILTGHSGAVSTVAYSRDGTHIVSGSYDHTIKLWDAHDGNEVRTLSGHSGKVLSAVISEDSTWVFSCGEDKKAILWNALHGTAFRSRQHSEDPVASVAFHERRQSLSFARSGCIRYWDVDDYEQVVPQSVPNVVELLKKREGGFSIYGYNGSTFTDETQGTQYWTRKVLSHKADILTIAISTDGRWLVSGAEDGSLQVFDLENLPVYAEGLANGTVVRRYSHVSFAPDGRRLVSVGGDAVGELWDVDIQSLIPEARYDSSGNVETELVRSVGEFVRDDKDRDFRRISTPNGGEVYESANSFGIQSMATSRDGRILACGGRDDTVQLWDIERKKLLRTINAGPGVIRLALNRDGTLMATGNMRGILALWITENGSKIRDVMAHEGAVNCLRFSFDASLVLSAGSDGFIRLWNTSDLNPVRTMEKSFAAGETAAVEFTPDGRRFFSGGEDGQLRIWDVETGLEVFASTFNDLFFFNGSTIHAIALSPDGRTIAVGFDGGQLALCESAAPPPAIREARARRASIGRIVARKKAEHVLLADLLIAIENDKSLTLEERTTAIDLARVGGEDANQLNEFAWKRAIRSDGTAESYSQALRAAEAAVGLARNNANIIKTLGVAQYRNGRFEEAIATLELSIEKNKGAGATDLAFIAMAQFKLGRVNDAKRTLVSMRRLLVVTGYGPEQATGEPDTLYAGDSVTAWASKSADGQDEWLVLTFERTVVPAKVQIHESCSPGAVVKVSVFAPGEVEVVVWEGKDPTPVESARGVSEISFNVDFMTNKLKIYLASTSVPDWNEIDAVGLVAASGETQWATSAEASSFYSDSDETAFLKEAQGLIDP